MKIKVAEKFYALQGEGRYVGTPSVFLRTFGCNFRCKKFGRNKDEVIDGPNPEVAEVIRNIGVYTKLEDMPLVSTGCDSYAAVYPEFKDFSPATDTAELAKQLVSLTPSSEFSRNVHLVITGGEPLMWQKQLAELADEIYLINNKKFKITFETNGTYPASVFMTQIAEYADIHFSVSPKLSCSGETREDAFKIDAIMSYLAITRDVDFKFVVATQDDIDEVKSVMNREFSMFRDIDVYLMPVGGLNEMYQLNKADVADLALKMGWKFSPRLQCDVSGNKWGT